MRSGITIWVLVTPPMLWSHYTFHIYSIYRISSPRHIPSSIMFFATSQLSPLSSTDHMDYDHVWSECVWSQSTHIDEQRQANTHSGPMTTWPAATHSGSIQLRTHKAKSHSPTGPRADFVRGIRQVSGQRRLRPHSSGSIQLRPHKAKSHFRTGSRADFVRGIRQVSGPRGLRPHSSGSIQLRPHKAKSHIRTGFTRRLRARDPSGLWTTRAAATHIGKDSVAPTGSCGQCPHNTGVRL